MSVKGIVKGLLVGAVLTLIFLLLLTVVAYFSKIPQEYLNIAMFVLTAVAVVAGAVICSNISGRKLVQNCLIYAISYMLLLTICSLIKNGAIAMNIRFFAILAGVVACSLLGAVIANRNFL